jgi:hypothetical protein
MWTTWKMSDRTVVGCTNNEISIGFFRHVDNSVWVVITPPAGELFDKERPPVLWADEHATDLMVDKSYDQISRDLDPTAAPSFSCDDGTVVFARVWHGLPAQGMGFVGAMLGATKLTVQIYLANFDVHRVRLDLDAPDLIRNTLQA